MFISRCWKDHFLSPFAAPSIAGSDVAMPTSQCRSSSQVAIHNADVYHVHYVGDEFLQPSEDNNLDYKKKKRRREKHVMIHNTDYIMSIMSVMSFCNHPRAIIEITKFPQTKAASKI